VFERRAFKIFHRKKSFAILITNVVDATDVGVVQRRRRLSFALKTGQS
jgi:hypothetical protein